MENPVQLTPRFTQAVDYARQVHVSLRKGTQVPYMAHLLGVASLVLGETGHVPFPVTEDMVIAALLHDAVEDEGGLPRLRDIEAKFGNKVAKIVEGCTDSFVEYPDKKQEWEERKSSYIERLWNEPPETLLVSVADKLYNAAQFWRTTDKSVRRSGVGSSEDASSSCGISTNSSRFTKRDARPGR